MSNGISCSFFGVNISSEHILKQHRIEAECFNSDNSKSDVSRFRNVKFYSEYRYVIKIKRSWFIDIPVQLKKNVLPLLIDERNEYREKRQKFLFSHDTRHNFYLKDGKEIININQDSISWDTEWMELIVCPKTEIFGIFNKISGESLYVKSIVQYEISSPSLTTLEDMTTCFEYELEIDETIDATTLECVMFGLHNMDFHSTNELFFFQEMIRKSNVTESVFLRVFPTKCLLDCIIYEYLRSVDNNNNYRKNIQKIIDLYTTETSTSGNKLYQLVLYLFVNIDEEFKGLTSIEIGDYLHRTFDEFPLQKYHLLENIYKMIKNNIFQDPKAVKALVKTMLDNNEPDNLLAWYSNNYKVVCHDSKRLIMMKNDAQLLKIMQSLLDSSNNDSVRSSRELNESKNALSYISFLQSVVYECKPVKKALAASDFQSHTYDTLDDHSLDLESVLNDLERNKLARRPVDKRDRINAFNYEEESDDDIIRRRRIVSVKKSNVAINGQLGKKVVNWAKDTALKFYDSFGTVKLAPTSFKDAVKNNETNKMIQNTIKQTRNVGKIINVATNTIAFQPVLTGLVLSTNIVTDVSVCAAVSCSCSALLMIGAALSMKKIYEGRHNICLTLISCPFTKPTFLMNFLAIGGAYVIKRHKNNSNTSGDKKDVEFPAYILKTATLLAKKLKNANNTFQIYPDQSVFWNRDIFSVGTIAIGMGRYHFDKIFGKLLIGSTEGDPMVEINKLNAYITSDQSGESEFAESLSSLEDRLKDVNLQIKKESNNAQNQYEIIRYMNKNEFALKLLDIVREIHTLAVEGKPREEFVKLDTSDEDSMQTDSDVITIKILENINFVSQSTWNIFLNMKSSSADKDDKFQERVVEIVKRWQLILDKIKSLLGDFLYNELKNKGPIALKDFDTEHQTTLSQQDQLKDKKRQYISKINKIKERERQIIETKANIEIIQKQMNSYMFVRNAMDSVIFGLESASILYSIWESLDGSITTFKKIKEYIDQLKQGTAPSSYSSMLSQQQNMNTSNDTTCTNPKYFPRPQIPSTPKDYLEEEEDEEEFVFIINDPEPENNPSNLNNNNNNNNNNGPLLSIAPNPVVPQELVSQYEVVEPLASTINKTNTNTFLDISDKNLIPPVPPLFLLQEDTNVTLPAVLGPYTPEENDKDMIVDSELTLVDECTLETNHKFIKEVSEIVNDVREGSHSGDNIRKLTEKVLKETDKLYRDGSGDKCEYLFLENLRKWFNSDDSNDDRGRDLLRILTTDNKSHLKNTRKAMGNLLEHTFKLKEASPIQRLFMSAIHKLNGIEFPDTEDWDQWSSKDFFKIFIQMKDSMRFIGSIYGNNAIYEIQLWLDKFVKGEVDDNKIREEVFVIFEKIKNKKL